MTDPSLKRKRSADVWLLVGSAVLAACLYFGTAIEPGTRLFYPVPHGYYGLQTEGFRAGHLYASITPHPALLALKNPYDPVANAPYRAHDMTLYGGHYYLYFGVTPILIAFWPVSAITGWYPSERAVVAAFCTGAVWIGLALLMAVRKRYFPSAANWVLALACLCLVFANPMSRLVQGTQFYQVAISCAIVLQMAMIAALYRALQAPRHPWRWLTLASVCFGLAVGARPNYLASGAALFAAALVLIGRTESGKRGRSTIQALAAAALPAAAIGSGLLLYNWLRFDSPFEFGMRYQLAGEIFLNLRPIQLRNIWPHLGDYLFQPGFWSIYFPFFDPPTGQPYGFLRYIPWGWLALVAFLPAAGGKPSSRAARAFVTVLALASVANLLMLASFFGTTDRYPGDYTTSWLLLSGIGALALSDYSARRRWRRLAHAGCGVLGVVAIFNASAAFIGHAPSQFPLLTMGRIGNWPAYAWRRVRGESDGALKITLQVGPGRYDESDPIFETGRSPGERDWLRLDYLRDHRVRVAFYHTGMGDFLSEPFPIPSDGKLVIETRCGSLVPPFSSPVFSGWSGDEYAALKRDLQVRVNGVERLRAIVSCYNSSPGDLTVGRLRWRGDGMMQTFSGRILAVERLPLEHVSAPAPVFREARPIELRLSLPAQHSPGGDPILVTGHGAQSDLLYCFYDGHGGIRFALDHFGGGGPQSETVRYEPTQLHRLTVWMGSLMGPEAAARMSTAAVGAAVPWSHRLVVKFDGHTVLNVEQVFYSGAPETALIGINPYGSTAAGEAFLGRVDRVAQIGFDGLPPLRPAGGYGAVDLSLQFPLAALGTREPLVVSGVAGAGDLIYISYLDARHVGLGFDHWGVGGFMGPPVEVDYGQTHRLSITMGSLYAGGGDPGRATEVRVTVDGQVALEGHSPGHPSAPHQIRIGLNPIGGSTCGPAFTGRILAVERSMEPRPWPPPLPGRSGPIELKLEFPAYVMGTVEPLVVTGVTGAGDLLFVRYVDAKHVSIGFDHWGVGGLTGRPIEIDYHRPHLVRLTMDSLYSDNSDAASPRLVKVMIDNQVALEGHSACHRTKLDQTRVGINPIGGSSCGPSFTGRIISVGRVP